LSGIEKEDEWEVREGLLRCEKCGQEFNISDGIVCTVDQEVLDRMTEREFLAKRNHPIFPETGCANTMEVLLNSTAVLSYSHPWIKDLLELTNGLDFNDKLILEIGAGAGDVSCWLANNYDCRVVSLDLSMKHLAAYDFFRTHLDNSNLYYERVEGNMADLPFPEKIFDFVIVKDALHHSSRLLKTLKEVQRVLKRGGKFFIGGEPCCGLFTMKRVDSFGKEDIEKGMNEHLYPFVWYYLLIRLADFHGHLRLLASQESALSSSRGNSLLGRVFHCLYNSVLGHHLAVWIQQALYGKGFRCVLTKPEYRRIFPIANP